MPIYHDRLVGLFLERKDIFASRMGIQIDCVETNVTIGGDQSNLEGEVDILIRGRKESQELTVLVEVKSRKEKRLIEKFLTRQLPTLRRHYPSSEVYLFVGTQDESLRLEDVRLAKVPQHDSPQLYSLCD